MKTRFLWMVLSVCLALPASAEKKEETPLGRQMEALDDAYKGFRREKDPAKGAAEARMAQEAVIKGLAETPEMLAKMPDGPAKVKAAAEFRKMMAETYVTLCKVELAFLEGKIDEVAGIIDELKKLKKAGHDQFMEEE